MFLGIDTCTFQLNLALVDEAGGLLEAHSERVRTQTTRLAPAVRDLLEKGGVGRGNLRAVGVVSGPGSFTGLRVGISAGLGLSLALGIPAYGMGSLEALARCCPERGEGLALLDARRGQVYLQRFRLRGDSVDPVTDPAAAPPEAALSGTPPEWAIGDGIPLVSGWPSGCSLHPEIPNLAVPAAARASEALAAGLAARPVRAVYIRVPDVRA